VLEKFLDAGISLHEGPFLSEGNLVWGGGYIPGTLIDAGRMALVVGRLSVRDSMKGSSFTEKTGRYKVVQI
jgi:hypothetical protein